MKKLLLIFMGALSIPMLSLACTSVIISGNATNDGKPIMLKHRDTDDQDNRIEFFVDGKYHFIGLVNSNSPGEEVWSGMNEAGFCIMNTASYNFRDDNDSVIMDQEGRLMYLALAECASVQDFEDFLNTYEKPYGVEANFGVIDAEGGAAYYEVNNYMWIKYDVNDPSIAPKGYRVATNFCEAGRREDYQGWERFIIASEVMENLNVGEINHVILYDSISRCTKEIDGQRIPRNITSASIVFEGVKAGENPKTAIMWTILGNPLNNIAIPLMVQNENILPDYMQAGYVYTQSLVKETEEIINLDFMDLYNSWISGLIEDEEFYKSYLEKQQTWMYTE